MKGKDKGFSLVELIVVIAIMAVATTIGGYALSTISLANTKNCATEIKSKLDLTRMEATRSVAEASREVLIYADESGVYLKVGDGDAERIGNSSVTVKCDGDGFTNANLIDRTTSNGGVRFSYDKSSGAFDKMECSKMVVSGAGREYTLTLYAKTGKIKME